MSLRTICQKQGGIRLLRRYFQSGALFTAGAEFLLLGHSTKALELLRLSADFKTKSKLEKKYRAISDAFDRSFDSALPHETSNKVWVCWFQGMEQAPELVQQCYRSLCSNLTDREIVLITADNMQQYVQFPDYIMQKWKNGQITHTHMTDLLRLELLIRYGGMWIDATVFCAWPRERIPDYFFDSDLFLYQTLKPGRDGQSQLMSSWLISAKTNNKILMHTRALCYEYWKTHTELVDYFLLHDFMSIALEHDPALWDAIIPRDNAAPHMLLLRFFEPYDVQIWNAICDQTPFHKLSYKIDKEAADTPGTFYKVLFAPEITSDTDEKGKNT